MTSDVEGRAGARGPDSPEIGPPGPHDPDVRLAAALRRASSLMVGRTISAEALAEAARAVEVAADALQRGAQPGVHAPYVHDPTSEPQDLFPASPVFGIVNPIAPPVRVWKATADDGRPELRGAASFDYLYEGPPNCVHGGVIAEVFDEMLGAANIVAGYAGMTGTLTIVYRRPTPLNTPLEMVARQQSAEGRKIFTWGGIYAGGELTAEANGIFVAIDPERFAALGDPEAGRSR